MRTLTFKSAAFKALRSVPKKDALAIVEKLKAYAAGERRDVVRLTGSHMLRLRHGDWRIVFEQSETEIAVLAIAHRREIYR
jgi:mRNA interferase RelE/StbE